MKRSQTYQTTDFQLVHYNKHFDAFFAVFVSKTWFFVYFDTFWAKTQIWGSKSTDCNAPGVGPDFCLIFSDFSKIIQSCPENTGKGWHLIIFERKKCTKSWPKSGQFIPWITGNWLNCIFRCSNNFFKHKTSLNHVMNIGEVIPKLKIQKNAKIMSK